MRKLLLPCLAVATMASCAGTRTTADHTTSHAVAFNLFGLPLIGNDYDAAWEQVPAGATIHTVVTSPKDWTSLPGILNNIMGVTSTQVSYTN
jgi:hypothetical protein